MADYSHLSALKVQPATIVSYDARGLRPTDDMFAEALTQIDPPLLSSADLQAVRMALIPRRGRPRKDVPSLRSVLTRLVKLARPDVPPRFLELLAARLESGKRCSRFDVDVQRLRERTRQERRTFLCFIYDELMLVLDDSRFVKHATFGRLEVPRDQATRSKKALAMTQSLLHKMERDPPGLRTMRNIVTERNRGRFRESKAV